MKVYVISSVLALGTLYVGSLLLIRNEKNFRFIRFFYLGCLVLGLAAPALSIDYGLDLPEVQNRSITNFDTRHEKEEFVEEKSVATYKAESRNFSPILFWIYLGICGVLLFRFGKNLSDIISRTKTWDGKLFQGLRILPGSERARPYSFFNYLFIHPDDLQDPDFKDSVIPHELAHSRELHTVDLIFAELICCCFWFNPFAWLFKTKIIENHEYLADSAVVKSGRDLATYSRQIIYNGNQFPLPITSGFSFIKTKNRINMLNKSKSSKASILIKAGMAIVLAGIVFTVSSFSLADKNSTPFVVVVDAGHGGRDTGASNNEKDVNFQISQQLKALSSKESIDIILVRQGDEFLTLKDRAAFASVQNADLFLSLHCNTSTDPSVRGVEAYYAPGNPWSAQSLQFSKILVSKQVEKVADRGEVKSANFTVLKDLPIPGALLELGYLSNPTEAARLRDPEHQKMIAKAIFEGLQKIKLQRN